MAATYVPQIPSDIGAQDALVSGTNIKTVNGGSIMGAGDLVVTGSGIPDAPSDGKFYVRRNGAWEILDIGL